MSREPDGNNGAPRRDSPRANNRSTNTAVRVLTDSINRYSADEPDFSVSMEKDIETQVMEAAAYLTRYNVMNQRDECL